MVYALDCKFGCCHNEVHDAIGNLASLVWGNVACQLVVCDQPTSLDGALVVD